METVKKFLVVLFGASWKTSLFGYLGAAAVELGTAMQGESAIGWHVVALALLALGRMAKDSGVTGGTTPVTPEAAARVAQPPTP